MRLMIPLDLIYKPLLLVSVQRRPIAHSRQLLLRVVRQYLLLGHDPALLVDPSTVPPVERGDDDIAEAQHSEGRAEASGVSG
jgi:hypothetical protein